MANNGKPRKIHIGVAWPTPTAISTWATWPAPTCRPISLPATSGWWATTRSWYRARTPTVRPSPSAPTREIFQRYHQTFLETYQQIGLTFDLFTHADTENHHCVSQDIFLKLLEPTELIHPRSKASGDTALEVRETEHYFLDLPKLSDELADYLDHDKEHWRPNVLNFARNYVQNLHGRPITRDIDWGIPIPLPGYEGKCLYVWFEAVIGYFSASVEWAHNQGTPDAWQAWWYDPEARIYNFIVSAQ